MKKYPKVKFKVDPEQDAENYSLFMKYAIDPERYIKLFLPQELHYTLEENFSTRKRSAVVKKWVKETFTDCKKLISGGTKGLAKDWSSVEGDYFKLMDKVFKNHEWPKGKYIGYASVFQMYPRDTVDKTFYFSGLSDSSQLRLATTAHEMTHFMFFDYIKCKYGISEETEFKGKNPNYLWNVSEVFNLVMERSAPYKKIFKTKGVPYDKTHAKMLDKMMRLWKEKKDIDHLLDKYLKNK